MQETAEQAGHLIIQIVGGIFALLLLASATQALTKRLRIPFTVGLVLVGILLTQLVDFGLAFLEPLVTMARDLPPEAVLFIFLPTLVLESAFNMEARALRENLTPVLTEPGS